VGQSQGCIHNASRSACTSGPPRCSDNVVLLLGRDGGDGLMINRGINDQTVRVVSGEIEIAVPDDAFAHTNPNAVVVLSARLANGDPLPDWLVFDPATGKFILHAAPGERKAVEVRVEARDGANNAVFTTFRIQVGEGQGGPSSSLDRSGRPGLSVQLRMAAQRPHGVLGRLRASAGSPSGPGVDDRTAAGTAVPGTGRHAA
jgi:hypothetical protein